MDITMLRLNTDKTELIFFSPQFKSETTEYQLSIGDQCKHVKDKDTKFLAFLYLLAKQIKEYAYRL